MRAKVKQSVHVAFDFSHTQTKSHLNILTPGRLITTINPEMISCKVSNIVPFLIFAQISQQHEYLVGAVMRPFLISPLFSF